MIFKIPLNAMLLYLDFEKQCRVLVLQPECIQTYLVLRQGTHVAQMSLEVARMILTRLVLLP